MEFAFLDFGLAWDTSPHPFFLFLPFGMGMPILRLFQYYIFKAHNLFGFTGSQLEKNFASGRIVTHPYVSFQYMIKIRRYLEIFTIGPLVIFIVP